MGQQLSVAESDIDQAPIATICVNAFRRDGDVAEYADPDPSDPSLEWTAYGRTEEFPGGKFGMPWEADFDTYDAAMAAARGKCAELGLDPDSIREY